MRSRHVIGMISCVACVIVVAGGTVSRATIFRDEPEAQKPYDGSRADRRLEAFDQSHPNCAMWTDWRKLCVRWGPGRKTVCDVDPSHPVPPSTPFCERETGYTDFTAEDGPKGETRAELRSRLRFSHLVDHGTRLWRPDRPFNGYAPEGFSYPGCHVWSYEDKAERSETCATDGRAGMASCSRAANMLAGTSAACLEIRAGDPCDPRGSEGLAEVIKPYKPEAREELEARAASEETELLLSRVYPPTIFPVLGFKCPPVK